MAVAAASADAAPAAACSVTYKGPVYRNHCVGFRHHRFSVAAAAAVAANGSVPSSVQLARASLPNTARPGSPSGPPNMFLVLLLLLLLPL